MIVLINRAITELLQDKYFKRKPKQMRLLEYLIDSELNKPTVDITEMRLALEIFDCDITYDPSVKSMVRTEIYRLRQFLLGYYKSKNCQIIFEMPKRSYKIRILIATSKQDLKLEYKVKNVISNKPRIIICFNTNNHSPIENIVMEEFSTRTVEYQGFNFEHSLSTNFLTAQATSNYSNETIYSIHLLMYTINNAIVIYVTLIHPQSNIAIWKKSYDITEPKKILLIRRVVRDIANDLFSEYGAVYQTLLANQSANIINKSIILASYYRTQLYGIDYWEFDSMLYLVEQFLQKDPDDADITAVKIYLILYAKNNFIKPNSIEDFSIQDALRKLILKHPLNREVQSLIHLNQYLMEYDKTLDDYSEYLRSKNHLSSYKQFQCAFWDYLKGQLRGYEQKLFRQFPFAKQHIPKSYLILLIAMLESENNVNKRVLVQLVDSIKFLKIPGGPLFHIYSLICTNQIDAAHSMLTIHPEFTEENINEYLINLPIVNTKIINAFKRLR